MAQTPDMKNVDSPPPYDYASEEAPKNPPPADVKHPEGPQAAPSVPFMTAGPSHIPHAGPAQPQVYYYMDPQTGNQIASLLPPDHPEMICLREGQHVTKTSFGLLGIIAAVLWFPLGVGLCLVDRRTTCTRCGTVLHNGVCN
ncbi:hypothetical protein EV121DRAFT_259127 [Schizophyllum commune]